MNNAWLASLAHGLPPGSGRLSILLVWVDLIPLSSVWCKFVFHSGRQTSEFFLPVQEHGE
jgi:hypothetical protein